LRLAADKAYNGASFIKVSFRRAQHERFPARTRHPGLSDPQAETLRDAAKAKGVKVFHLTSATRTSRARPVMDTFHAGTSPSRLRPGPGFSSCARPSPAIFAKYGIPLGPDEVLITTGGSEAIHFTFSVIGDVGDEVIIPEPYYTNYNGYASFAGLRIAPCRSASRTVSVCRGRGHRVQDHPPDQGHSPLLPQQPDRHRLHARGLERVVGLVKKHDLFLIGEDLQRVHLRRLKHKSVLEYEDVKERVVVVDSISKRYSCCGARTSA